MPRNGLITEKELQESIVRAMRDAGWRVDFAWRSLHSPKGRPDITAEKNGNWLIVELKDGSKLKNGLWRSQPTPDQVEWLLRYWKLGVHLALADPDGAAMGVYLWRPDDIDEAYKILYGQQRLDPGGWLREGLWTVKPVVPLLMDPRLTEIARYGYPDKPVTPGTGQLHDHVIY